MAEPLISFPFRLGPNGSVVTLLEDSPDYQAELIAALVTTVPGERPQVPLFGVNDPAFNGIDAQELVYKISLFGPPVKISAVKMRQVTDTEQDVWVEFVQLAPDTPASAL